MGFEQGAYASGGGGTPVLGEVVDCPKCEGTGRIPRSDGSEKSRKCPVCGGVGIQTPGDDAALKVQRATRADPQFLGDDGVPVVPSKAGEKQWRKAVKVLLKARRLERRVEQERRRFDVALDELNAANDELVMMAERLAAVEKSVQENTAPLETRGRTSAR